MIHFAKVTKQYGTKILYKNASFQINPGDKMGLVGPNGAGKTTIFRILTNDEGVDGGSVGMPGQIRLSYFSQDIEDMRGKTVLEEVVTSLKEVQQCRMAMLECEELLSQELSDEKMQAVLEKYGDLQVQFESLGGYDVENKAKEILTGLGIGPEDQERKTETFSGGWKMRIALAKVLAQNPQVLLMDEPTNHLDLESIVWLEEWIRQFQGAILMTSHDRDFMNRLVTKIVEVANQTITVYTGNYDFYEREKEIRMTQLHAQAQRQEDMLAKEQEFIARFQARASHAAQVQSRIKKIEKIDRVEIPAEEKDIQFVWPEIPRGGDEVVKLEKLGKTFGVSPANANEKQVLKNVNALVKRLDRVAVVGVNGAGKSTLLKIIAQQTDPTEGRAMLGPSIQMGYFSQNSMDILDPEKTILEEMESRVPNLGIGVIRNLLGALKFSGDSVEKKIKVLSGGEKSRVVLATILAKPINFLVLDEPTNHLDIQSREVLLKAIQEFPGTVMIVSHDRYFLRKIVNRVFHVEKQAVQVFDGTWDEYAERVK